jgi:iron(III) transport system substrate-binding protein
MSYLSGLANVLVCVLSLAIAPPARSQTLQSLAAYNKADREQRLIQGAKKEGALMLYTAIPGEYLAELREPFEKKYGIKVNVWRATGETILQKVMQEAKGGIANADVIHSTAVVLEALRAENMMQEIRSPVHGDLIPSAVPAHRQYASTLQYVFVQAYNTEKVRKEELPKTYEELLAPKWRGKLAIEANDAEWVASVIDDMGGAKGIRFFEDLVVNNLLSVRKGHALLVNLVASGEVPLALTVYQYAVEQLKKKNAPIDWFAIEPAVSMMSGMGVPKNAPRPFAALLFYDYMLGPEGQSIVAKIGYVPTHAAVESPLKGVKLKYLDGAALFKEQEKSLRQLEAILETKR